uniref:Uncharacterized protein n=1 Tax=Octopus bimaculoides TaxID=37653 RepID=A0A0L8H026_OCTBM
MDIISSLIFCQTSSRDYGLTDTFSSKGLPSKYFELQQQQQQQQRHQQQPIQRQTKYQQLKYYQQLH